MRLLKRDNFEYFFEFIQLTTIALVIVIFDVKTGMLFGIMIGVWRIGDILRRRKIIINIVSIDNAIKAMEGKE